MFLGREERDAAQLLSDALARDGIEIHLDTQTTRVRVEGSDKSRTSFTTTRSAHGRRRSDPRGRRHRPPTSSDLNLEAAGVAFDSADGIPVDDFLRTTNPRIFAAGDVCAGNKCSRTSRAPRGASSWRTRSFLVVSG
jgi:pyruvate/2-oxoglutarate dehydrogenase complex dihydrolipoamide dehydrogenase (E3) component